MHLVRTIVLCLFVAAILASTCLGWATRRNLRRIREETPVNLTGIHAAIWRGEQAVAHQGKYGNLITLAYLVDSILLIALMAVNLLGKH